MTLSDKRHDSRRLLLGFKIFANWSRICGPSDIALLGHRLAFRSAAHALPVAVLIGEHIVRVCKLKNSTTRENGMTNYAVNIQLPALVIVAGGVYRLSTALALSKSGNRLPYVVTTTSRCHC